MEKPKTIRTRAEIEGQEVVVCLDLTFPEHGAAGEYRLNEEWKQASGLSRARLEGVDAWLQDVNAAGERIEHEQFFAQALKTRFTTFMERQGFAATFDAGDGTRVFEREATGDRPGQTLAFRSLYGLEFQFKELELGVVEEELDGTRERDGFPPLSFDGLEGEARPLTEFLREEGLTSIQEMAEELRAWRTVYESPSPLPSPMGIAARVEGEVPLDSVAQVARAKAFAACLQERGFNAIGVFDGLPLLARGPTGIPDRDHLVWRIGNDGEPHFKQTRERPQHLPFGYGRLDAPERDFTAFLRQERLPLSRLPEKSALSLPLESAPALQNARGLGHSAGLTAGPPRLSFAEAKGALSGPERSRPTERGQRELDRTRQVEDGLGL